MSIEVNGRGVEFVEGETVAGLLTRMNFVYKMLVVKIDGRVVPKMQYSDMVIDDGARIEIIHIESGG